MSEIDQPGKEIAAGRKQEKAAEVARFIMDGSLVGVTIGDICEEFGMTPRQWNHLRADIMTAISNLKPGANLFQEVGRERKVTLKVYLDGRPLSQDGGDVLDSFPDSLPPDESL